jgi:blue copper oxidase
MKPITMIVLAALMLSDCFAQTLIPIPDTLTGNTINLTVKDSVHQFRPGNLTATMAYNGSYLGPTIILNKAQAVQMNVDNMLMDTTTVHWHGLHVAPSNDGGPHTPIVAGYTWSPAFTVLDKAAMYWYHPHLHGTTMQQVVMGAAGLILVRDSEEAAITLPRTYGVDDVPLIFQFKTMDMNNQWVMEDDTDNVVLVNGVFDAYVNSPAQVVRYRILNASTMRVFRFGFSDNRSFSQITTDAGLLNAPVALTRLTLGPGERAEILVNLTGLQGDTLNFQTFGNELATGVPGGPPAFGDPQGPLDNITFTVLQIHVVAPTGNPVTTIPSSLSSNVVWSQTGVPTRNFSLTGVPMNNPVNWFINGVQFDMETINFYTQQDNIEIWNIDNNSMMAHPFHIHGNYFYILNRNGLPPPDNEKGRKDVVLINPQASVTVITKFEDFYDDSIPYMYHCHFLDHEDNGMMGQFIVNASSTGTNDLHGSNDFIIYPNPASDLIAVRNSSSIVKNFTIHLFDVTGKLVYEKTIAKESTFLIPVKNLADGMYVLTLSDEKSVRRKKVIVRH